MHFLTTLAALASVTGAIHIDFKRFAHEACDAKHHIRKTSDLHDTTCKTFSHHELGFHSFSFAVTDDDEDLKEKDCRIVVFPTRECKGEGVTYGDMSGMEHACASLPDDMEGRSVKLECGKKPDAPVRILSPRPGPPPSSTKTLTMTPTTTVTHTHAAAKPSTMTVVPAPAAPNRVKVCHYEDLAGPNGGDSSSDSSDDEA